jgi:hypothetical protein
VKTSIGVSGLDLGPHGGLVHLASTTKEGNQQEENEKVSELSLMSPERVHFT